MGESQFDRVGVFQYSPEEHTPALKLPNIVPEEVKQERYSRLMELQREVSLARNKRNVGRTLNVLIDEPASDDSPAVGRTEADAPEVDNEVIIEDRSVSQGDFTRVRITDALEYDLVGELANEYITDQPKSIALAVKAD